MDRTCLFFDRHTNSKSLVLYPEALCTQTWTQMNLMAVFNEDIFTAFGHDGFTDISPAAWDTDVDQKLA